MDVETKNSKNQICMSEPNFMESDLDVETKNGWNQSFNAKGMQQAQEFVHKAHVAHSS